MRPGALLDTGPLVAYLSPWEANHGWATEQLATLDPPLLTCEPVLTEACFLVARAGRSAVHIVEMVRRGVLRIEFALHDELAAIRSLMERYATVPMSLADACLVRMAEMSGLRICTLDHDFAIYRAHGRRGLSLILPPAVRSLHEP